MKLSRMSRIQGIGDRRGTVRQMVSVTLSILLVLMTLQPGVGAQQRRGAARARSGGVRLVVGIVIDQFRYDYLTRFEDQFVEGGFRRFLTQGANFTDNNYLHTPTYTAPGHATFMSGTTPALNGIIGNEWFDRETGRVTTSVSDGSVKQLGGKDGATGASPRRLIGSTLGDEMKLASRGKAKVIGVSLKDRSAILPAGKRPDGAYWFDGSTGNFVSSTYYFADLPEWVKRFNREQHPNRYFDKVWERLLPEAAYARSEPDDSAYEGTPAGRVFPHVLKGEDKEPGARFYGDFQASPFANDHLANLAKAAIENEGLGTDETADLLTISFSSNDLVGHEFGPYSQEVQDITLRTDRTLADLFTYIDQRIGLEHVVFALTADHGVAPVPEQVTAKGYGGRLDGAAINNAIEKALDERFGEEKWVLNSGNGNIYFDLAAVERRKVAIEEVEKVGAATALSIKGIAACYTRSQIIFGSLPETRLAKSVALGFHPQRNGNLVIITDPFYLASRAPGTSHGTPYSYDTHVPLLLLGPGVRAGRYYQPSSPADIAPTLAAILRVDLPSNRLGRILGEALN